MISITQDAELITNLISANPVPASNRFFAFTDEQNNPAVLSHSQDNKLDLIINVDGKPQLKNLGEIWGLSGAVQACALLQDTEKSVFIAVATDAGDEKSRLYLIYNTKPADLLTYDADKIVEGSDLFPKIHGIYMSNFTRKVGDKVFPMIFLALQPWDRITKEDQLAYVNISKNNDGNIQLSLNTSWTLATNPLKILDVTFGTCKLGQGAFVLYQTKNSLKLQFRVFEGRNYSVEFVAPSGATCLASYFDLDKKSSVFLVGGDKITQYTYDDYKKSKAVGTTLSTDPPSELKDIHADWHNDQITIWFTTSTDAAYYYAASTKSIDDGTLVQLLPDGAGGQISSLLYSDGAQPVLVRTLVSVDESGQLALFQQASDTGMWEASPLYVASDSDNIEVDSFTIRIKALSDAENDENQSTLGCSLHIAASGYVRVLRNGKAAFLNQGGDWFEADFAGVVTIIVPTTDMSCQTLTIDQFKAPNGNVTPLDVPLINPSSKLNDNLAFIKTGQDLLNAKTQSGKSLIAPGTVSQADADNAASMIQQLNAMQMTMHLSGSSASQASSSNDLVVQVRGESTDSDPSLWDFFLFLYEKARDVESWFLQAVDDVIHFVCKWAGTVYRFVLDTVTAVGKVLSWVFAKITVGIKGVIDFVGYIFNWQDVLNTSDSIVTYLNVGLNYGQNKLADLDVDIKVWLQDAKAALKKLIQENRPDNITINGQTVNAMCGGGDNSSGKIQHGVAFNWSTYQMTHGGVVTSSNVSTLSTSESNEQLLSDLWDDVAKEATTLSDLVKNLIQDTISLFEANTLETDKVLDKITDDVLDAIFASLEIVADFMLKATSLLIRTFRAIGNAAIECPIFSDLWRLIAGPSRPLTLFDLFGLILAIPSVVLYKVARQVAPPILTGRLTEERFAQYVSDPNGMDQTLRSDMQAVASVTAISAARVGLQLTLISFVLDSIEGSDVSMSNLALNSNKLGTSSFAHTFAFQQAATGEPLATRGQNIVDVGVLIMEGIGLAVDLPRWYSNEYRGIRWIGWTLDSSNFIVLLGSRIVGMIKSIKRVETKRVVGCWEGLTSLPTLMCAVIVDVNNYAVTTDPQDKETFMGMLRHLSEDFLKHIASGSFFLAATTDGIKELKEVTWGAIGIMAVAISFRIGLKILDFVVEDKITSLMNLKRKMKMNEVFVTK